MGRILGIDFGTTYSRMAIFDGKGPVIIPNSEGKRQTPSIVAFIENVGIVIGDPAKRQALVNSANTITSVKRLIGKKFSEVQNIINRVPYKIIEIDDGLVGIKVLNTIYTPQEIAAYIFQKLKTDAENFLNEEFSEAIITVPAKFGRLEIESTKEAAEIAGFKVRRVITEATAASLTYGMNEQDEKVAIFDLGGGSLDVSILGLGENVFEVTSTLGDLNIGGDDFDLILVRMLLEEFNRQFAIDLSYDPIIVCRLKEAAEKAKIELSTSSSTTVQIPYITIGSNRDLSIVVSADTFKLYCAELIYKSKMVCLEALKNSNGFWLNGTWQNDHTDLTELIFIGGSTRMPFIKEEISKLFKVGCQNKFNSVEVVALGASVEGGVLSGVVNDVLLLDATPIYLGVEVIVGGQVKFYPVVNSYAQIPLKKTVIFINQDNDLYIDTLVENDTDRGNSKWATENKYGYLKPYMENENAQNFIINIIESDGITQSLVGVVQLDNISKLKAKPNEISVTFDIDANGTSDVLAKDMDSFKESKSRIKVKTALQKNQFQAAKERLKLFKESSKGC